MQYNDVPGSDEEMELGVAGSDVSSAGDDYTVPLNNHFDLTHKGMLSRLGSGSELLEAAVETCAGGSDAGGSDAGGSEMSNGISEGEASPERPSDVAESMQGEIQLTVACACLHFRVQRHFY